MDDVTTRGKSLREKSVSFTFGTDGFLKEIQSNPERGDQNGEAEAAG